MFCSTPPGPANGCPLAQVIPKMVSALGDGRATGALRALTALSATGHDALAKNALPKVQEFICRWGLLVSTRMLAFVVILYTYITYIYICNMIIVIYNMYLIIVIYNYTHYIYIVQYYIVVGIYICIYINKAFCMVLYLLSSTI